jgi:FkbM family methyltransferase
MATAGGNAMAAVASTEGGMAPLCISLAPRCIAEIVRMPPLAAAQLQGRGGKPRGWPRLWRKGVKSAYRLLHQKLRIPARGDIIIAPGGIARRFSADFSNTAYIHFADRIRRGGYEPEITALFDALAPRLRIAFDIGANLGYFVAVLASHPRFCGSVQAFEIAPRTAQDLRRLVRQCGFADRVTCHSFGLSDRSGPARIEQGLHSALTKISTRGAPVEVARLDDLDLPPPDLVKIDVEGHEGAVLRGGARRLARHRPIIVFESWFSPDAAGVMMQPFAILGALGYGFFRPSWRCDGTMGRLRLEPLDAQARPTIAEALNVVAVHPDRLAWLAEAR